MATIVSRDQSLATPVTDPSIRCTAYPDESIRHHAIVVVIDGREHEVKIEFRRGGADMAETHALTPALAQALRPETFEMVRRIDPSHHKTNRPGLFWFSSANHFVAHESRLEAMSLLSLDFEGQTSAVVSQPFRLHLTGAQSPRDHVPDYFARTRDGQGVAIDVKPRALLGQTKVAAQFAATRSLCEQAGWEYRIMSEPSDSVRMNLTLLSGYRVAPVFTDVVLPQALDVLGDGAQPWQDLVGHCAQRTGLHAALVAPCLFHVLWDRLLDVNLGRPLTASTPVSAGGAA